MSESPMINSEGVTWFKGIDGRIWRIFIKSEGKKCWTESIYSWSIENAPSLAEISSLISEPTSVASISCLARAKKSIV